MPAGVRFNARVSTRSRLALALLLASHAAAATAADPRRWVTAWYAAPHGAAGRDWRGREPDRPDGFADQSLRMIVTPHAAGRRVRLRLSNAFGTQAVTITAASVGRRRTGPAVSPRTTRPLTFAGAPSVTIPGGQVVVSDPVIFRTVPFRDLAITLAFGERTGPPTYHHLGLQTSWVSPPGTGDLTADESGTPFTDATTMRWFLSGVEVLSARSAGTIVAAGDSLTDGDTGLANPDADTTDRRARWPDFLQRRVARRGSRLSLANAGIAGNGLLFDPPAGLDFPGPALVDRFDRDVLAQPNLAGVIVLIGINDLGFVRASAEAVIAGLESLAERAHDAGVPIAVGTLTPGGGSFYDTGDFDERRQAVNRWIRRQDVFDAVVDFDQALGDPADPRRLQPAYDAGDHLHPAAAGYDAMARAVDLEGLLAAFRGRPPLDRALAAAPRSRACRQSSSSRAGRARGTATSSASELSPCTTSRTTRSVTSSR
jgi:lysophospholipase L1-like esterase